jgi:hypothetical protein
MEELVHGEELTEFIKSSRDGIKAFIAQRCTNQYGQYLAEYGGGG